MDARLEQKKTNLIAYLMDCVMSEDWHGVADAAMDLREVEVEIRLTKSTVEGDLPPGY